MLQMSSLEVRTFCVKEHKAREDEHWRQDGIEKALKRELESRHRIQQM
jgi:hypothetical protein